MNRLGQLVHYYLESGMWPSMFVIIITASAIILETSTVLYFPVRRVTGLTCKHNELSLHPQVSKFIRQISSALCGCRRLPEWNFLA
jgi:hypothetical protein